MIVHKIREKKYLEKEGNMMRSCACCLQRRGTPTLTRKLSIIAATTQRSEKPVAVDGWAVHAKRERVRRCPWKSWNLAVNCCFWFDLGNTSKAVESPPCIHPSIKLNPRWRLTVEMAREQTSTFLHVLPFSLLSSSSVGPVLCPVANFLGQLKTTVLDDHDQRLDLSATQLSKC